MLEVRPGARLPPPPLLDAPCAPAPSAGVSNAASTAACCCDCDSSGSIVPKWLTTCCIGIAACPRTALSLTHANLQRSAPESIQQIGDTAAAAGHTSNNKKRAAGNNHLLGCY